MTNTRAQHCGVQLRAHWFYLRNLFRHLSDLAAFFGGAVETNTEWDTQAYVVKDNTFVQGLVLIWTELLYKGWCR